MIGIDLGGTNLQFGVFDSDHRIVGRARGKTEAAGGLNQVIANLVTGVKQACQEAGISLDNLGAIGIAAAGAIDIPRGVILTSPNLGWTDVPLRDLLGQQLDRPIVLDNDVNGAVWAEHRLGAGRGAGDVLGVWVGTGIGGGLVLNRQVYHGDSFTAGEIGHTVIEPDGGRGRRTVEDLCSRRGMSRTLRELMPKYPGSVWHRSGRPPSEVIDSAALAEAYNAGDPLTIQVIHGAADLLGLATANWVTVLSLKTVIIGGGITEVLGEPYLDRIRESFRTNVFPPELQASELRMTELAADAGLLGAALLARESPR